MGLFPANWASFVEWFHRFVAMITGFAILGSTYAAWRGGYSRRIKLATGIATVVLPLQILLGANTIFNFGATAQVLHHGAAQTIFGALVAATAWAYSDTTAESSAATTDATATAHADD